MRHIGALVGATALGLIALLISPNHVLAQETGFPPFPILATGEAYVEGELLTEPGVLTVQVGDWESRPVQVTSGRFGLPPGVPIVIGPPSFDYVGQIVTFHLNGELQASLSFPFEALGEPQFVDVTLEFDGLRGLASPPPRPTALPTLVEDGEPSETAATLAETDPSGTPASTWVLGGAIAGLVGLATAVGLRARSRLKKQMD